MRMSPYISDATFQREHGSYLRNVVPGLAPEGKCPGTCSICAAPVSLRYSHCLACSNTLRQLSVSGQSLPLDYLTFLTYAVEGLPSDNYAKQALELPEGRNREGRQAYKVLRGYKADNFDFGARRAAIEWIAWWMQRQGPRPSTELRAWATPPSRRSGRDGQHPLNKIVGAVVAHAGEEVQIVVNDGDVSRDLNEQVYRVTDDLSGVHVLLVEDSWASGGSVLSAAYALKSAGAHRVSAMVLGRILNPNWPPTYEFIKHGGLQQPFDPTGSPWKSLR